MDDKKCFYSFSTPESFPLCAGKKDNECLNCNLYENFNDES